MLTDLEKGRIDKAMQECAGDRAAAARALGMSAGKLKDTIHHCPDLKLRWAKSRRPPPAPSASEILNRPPVRHDSHYIPHEPIPKEADVEKLLALADEKFHKGLMRSPMTGEERNLTEQLHELQTRHGSQVSETIHACAALMAIKLTNTSNKLIEQLGKLAGKEEISSLSKEENAANLSKLALLLGGVPHLTAEIRKLSDMVGKNNLAKASLEFKKNQSAMPRSKQKPGFAPLVAVNVAEGGKVELNDPKTKKAV